MLSRCALAAAALCVTLAGGPASAADSPRAVIEKAVKACGGKDLLNKYPAGQMEFKGTLQLMGIEVAFTGKTVYQIPGRERNQMDMEVGGQKVSVTQIVDGDKLKVTANGTDAPLSDAQKEEIKQSVQLLAVYQLTPLLEDKKYTLKSLGEAPKVDDKETVGVAVTAKGLNEVKLYFDKATGLPVRVDRRGLDAAEREGDEVILFKDYKKFQGIQAPTRWEMTHDGKKMMDMEVTKMTYTEKADSKEFDVSD